MREDHPSSRKRRRELAQAGYQVFVRQTVEAVAPHAFVAQAPWQCEGLRQMALATMKGGIEAGNLRHARCGGEDRANGGEVVRLMQRRQWAQRLQCAQHVAIQLYRRIEAHATMHHAVSDADDRCTIGQACNRGKNLARCRVVIELLVRPGALLYTRAPCILDTEMRLDADPFDLPTEQQRLVRTGLVQRELDAG